MQRTFPAAGPFGSWSDRRFIDGSFALCANRSTPFTRVFRVTVLHRPIPSEEIEAVISTYGERGGNSGLACYWRIAY